MATMAFPSIVVVSPEVRIEMPTFAVPPKCWKYFFAVFRSSSLFVSVNCKMFEVVQVEQSCIWRNVDPTHRAVSLL